MAGGLVPLLRCTCGSDWWEVHGQVQVELATAQASGGSRVPPAVGARSVWKCGGCGRLATEVLAELAPPAPASG